MVRWPCDDLNADAEPNVAKVYTLNEQGVGGYYPVGISNMWHSGIHIPRGKGNPIFSLLDGKLVAYRISEEYAEVDKESIITEVKYNSFEKYNQDFYKIQDRKLWDPVTYKLKDEHATKKDSYSNNFVLMSHELLLTADSGEKIKFYTLYMNLAPDSMHLTPEGFEKGYEDIIDVHDRNYKIPFYREWKFEVKTVTEGIPEYAYVNGATVNATEIGKLKTDDEFAMCNGDDDFFLNAKDDEGKDAIVIQRYKDDGTKEDTMTVVKMADIKGKLKVKSVPNSNFNLNDGSIVNTIDAHADALDAASSVATAWKPTTEQCIGFPAKLPSTGEYLYDLVLILEKDLLSGEAKTEFFKDKLYKDKVTEKVPVEDGVTGTEEVEKLLANLLPLVESGITSNIIEKKTGTDEGEYVKLFYTDSNVYYKRDKASARTWENFFEKPQGDESPDDIFCDIITLINLLDTETPIPDGIISKDELHIIFGTGNFYNETSSIMLRSKLRKFICQHPLEWNKNLYNENGNFITKGENRGLFIHKPQQERMELVGNATDIWNDDAGGNGLRALLEAEIGTIANDNCLWFAHPIYFVNHLKREGLLDFNPYEGKVLSPRFPDAADLKKYPTCKDDYKEIEVKSCPGFAPVRYIEHITSVQDK